MDYRERWELKDYLIGRTLERRIRLVHVGLALLLVVFLLDFWYLQGVKGDTYANLAENNRLRRIPVKPTRGVIFDRRSEVIASTRPSLDLVLLREGTRDLDEQLERLAPIVGETVEELRARWDALRGRPLFEPLVVREDVDLEALARIEARRERFPSVEIRQSARRHYPESDIASHAVGYVGQVSESALANSVDLQSGDIVGKSGIERTFDETLRGVRGSQLVSVNNLGRQIGVSRVETEPNHGAPLELTLDLRLQRALREGLGDEAGAGVFMDPRTGELLALVSTPTFDPNIFADGLTHDEWQSIMEDPRRPLHDRAIASFYAPGSTFKVVMAIAGLETGTIDPQERVFCNGSASFYKRRRLCWKRGGHGWVSLNRALAESCNVYFYTLGQKLGIDEIHKYGAMFGLGQLSGVDLPGEDRGIMPSQAWKLQTQREPWYPGDTISVAIGQGLLAVTPIQITRMIAGVATGGELPTPHLRKAAPAKPKKLSIRPSTFTEVRAALARAVQRGTATRATNGEFTVAGKTGTAQVYKHSAGIDSDKLPKAERDHAWFVGYAPAEDPRIAFAVVVEHGGHGGSAAAPIVRKVLEVFFAEPEPDPTPPSTGLTAEVRGPLESSRVRSPSAR